MGDTFDELVELFKKYGNEKYMRDEDITQIGHALEAAEIADKFGAPNYIIIGLLWHDCGQVVDKTHSEDVSYLHEYHDKIGYEWLMKKGYPEKVANIAKYHAMAKIHLCSSIPFYYEKLSKASKDSLLIQKNKYKENMKKIYEDDDMEEYLIARLCDDMAKKGKVKVNDFDYYRKMSDDTMSGIFYCKNDNWKEEIRKHFFCDGN